MSIRAEPVPEGALLARYRDLGYTDCFTTEVACRVQLGDFIQAFYTTPLFRLERFVLARFGHRSSDHAVSRLTTDGRRPG